MGLRERKLLLVAVSGVRCRDQELLKIGLTLPGFLERSKVVASLPSLGLLTLAGLTPDHWHVEYVEIDDLTEERVGAMREEGFDLVGISALSARIFDAYALSDRLRGQGIRVVIGGLHATALPEEAEGHADAVVVGEGEAVWRAVIADAEAGGLRKRYSSFDPAFANFALAEAPLPRYDLLDPEKYNRLTLQTSRGCPLNCGFCGASRLLSSYKLKPMAVIRRELEAILAVWPRPFIELADDNTFVNKEWSKELARMLGEYPIRWFTETDISVAEDGELLELLAESHCAQVLVGLESAKPEGLRNIDAANWKFRQGPGYLKKIERIQSHGISVNGCFILGLDTDTVETFGATRDFVLESELSEVQLTLLTPFPGTALEKQMRAEGRLLREVYWDACTLFDVTYRPKNMTAEELGANFRQLGLELYSTEAVAKRRSLFKDQVRRSAGARREKRVKEASA